MKKYGKILVALVCLFYFVGCEKFQQSVLVSKHSWPNCKNKRIEFKSKDAKVLLEKHSVQVGFYEIPKYCKNTESFHADSSVFNPGVDILIKIYPKECYAEVIRPFYEGRCKEQESALCKETLNKAKNTIKEFIPIFNEAYNENLVLQPVSESVEPPASEDTFKNWCEKE